MITIIGVCFFIALAFLIYLVIDFHSVRKHQQVWNALSDADKIYVKKRLEIYDNSHPKTDQLRMINEIASACNLSQIEAVACIQQCREEEIKKSLL